MLSWQQCRRLVVSSFPRPEEGHPVMPRGLSPDVMLSVTLDAICSRNRYTTDPAPVIAELYETAGDRTDLLTESVGIWVGYFDSPYIEILTTALREILGLEPWIAVGEFRRALPDHRTPAHSHRVSNL